ncbi:hypothetical protein OESDEN_16497 [Oesophagostomum dentatum]|uniref:Uncharacterized protein n=1 Tax=Oesophagostomum dentatum TaxID=61180 RepID=A0A0B1SFU1_OESDE|nr:hypothetical protein OESDEN_16497 [Oesophagostomum dentatum]
MTPKCGKGVYKEGFPQTFNKMEDGCQIEKSSGALICICSKDYCSSDHTFIMGLWEKSPLYKADHEYTECLETILRSEEYGNIANFKRLRIKTRGDRRRGESLVPGVIELEKAREPSLSQGTFSYVTSLSFCCGDDIIMLRLEFWEKKHRSEKKLSNNLKRDPTFSSVYASE